MRRAALGLLAALCTSLPAMSAGDDRALFQRVACSGAVKPGAAMIDDALQTIVPYPYRIFVEETVPQSMRLSWGCGEDWMEVLRRSLSPLGLSVIPDWGKNLIRVTWSRGRADSTSGQQMRGEFLLDPPRPENANAGVLQAPPVAVWQAQPLHVAAKPADVASDRVIEHFLPRGAGLPPPSVMRQMMRAAVYGGEIRLTGMSAVSSESARAKHASAYVHGLRDRLLAIGFPLEVLVVETSRIKQARPGVYLTIVSPAGGEQKCA